MVDCFGLAQGSCSLSGSGLLPHYIHVEVPSLIVASLELHGLGLAGP